MKKGTRDSKKTEKDSFISEHVQKFDKNLIQELKIKHAEPLFEGGRGGVSGINRMFFAHLISETKELIFESNEQKLYSYNDLNGLWEEQTRTQISSLVSKVFSDFCRREGKAEAIGKCGGGLIKDIKELLTGIVEKKDFFTSYKDSFFIHCANDVLVYDDDENKWDRNDFSKKYRSRNRTEFDYKPEAKCHKFLENLIRPAMSKEDAELLQFYMGQCVLAHNHDQSFLLMTGTPGGGKSTTVNILESIIGDFNVTELRLEHMTSRFESQRLVGKTLLTGKDVRSNFLNTAGASKLKALVGNDPLTTEAKGQNNVSKIRGNFNVIITANNNLKITLDGDLEAWRRRMLWIKYDREPPKEIITDFDIQLLKSEGSGILNWALDGAAMLMKNKGKIPRDEKQKKRINDLLEESDSVNIFVKECVVKAPKKDMTSGEMLLTFNTYCKQRGWELLKVNTFSQALRLAMLKYHNTNQRNDIARVSGAQRGYFGVKLKPAISCK